LKYRRKKLWESFWKQVKKNFVKFPTDIGQESSSKLRSLGNSFLVTRRRKRSPSFRRDGWFIVRPVDLLDTSDWVQLWIETLTNQFLSHRFLAVFTIRYGKVCEKKVNFSQRRLTEGRPVLCWDVLRDEKFEIALPFYKPILVIGA
jgi:hypothetical protein